jgi:hypothetical protein
MWKVFPYCLFCGAFIVWMHFVSNFWKSICLSFHHFVSVLFLFCCSYIYLSVLCRYDLFHILLLPLQLYGYMEYMYICMYVCMKFLLMWYFSVLLLLCTSYTHTHTYYSYRNMWVPGSDRMTPQRGVSQSRNAQPFMEPDSLPCSQDPTTGFYTDPDASSPHLCTLFLWDPF